jgi:hypothetical protein
VKNRAEVAEWQHAMPEKPFFRGALKIAQTKTSFSPYFSEQNDLSSHGVIKYKNLITLFPVSMR